MLAVDTNVVVRYLVDDDVRQARIAREVIDTNQIQLLDSVLLETEWVLRSLYEYNRERVHAGLSAVISLRQVRLETPRRVAQALVWFAQGMDFADAMHLASCEDCDAFATFDRKLVATARKAKAFKVRAL